MTAPGGDPSDASAAPLIMAMVDALTARRGGAVTWLNHYSALQCLDGGVPLEDFDLVGIDGILLAGLVRTAEVRTSADLVLPVLLERCPGLRIALVGSTPETLEAVRSKIESDPGHRVVLAVDGYAGLPGPDELRRQLVAAEPDLVVIGLGAPRQDLLALSLRAPGMLIATCGGWLDQFPQEQYYPSWAYPLRLNWLVRLCREPRRLWRRYTVDALRAVRRRRDLASFVARSGAVSEDNPC